MVCTTPNTQATMPSAGQAPAVAATPNKPISGFTLVLKTLCAAVVQMFGWRIAWGGSLALKRAVIERARLNERWGEAPMALCVVAPGATITEAEIVAMCADHLGSYKKPARVEFRTEPLPKSPVGKLQRKVLREPYWAGRDRRVAGN